MNRFLPYAVPDLGDEEIADVAATLRSGWLTTRERAQATAPTGSDSHLVAHQ
jgi:dTDP-4-amino-4,6-dideoxygalactose transaminase